MTTDLSFLAAGAVTASLVVDENGSTRSQLGNSRGIGNQTDLNLLLWLRNRSQIVLTSGITAEAEDYRYPSNTNLAILTNSNRNYPRLSDSIGKVRFLSNMSFLQAVESLLAEGITQIHTEFGETGFQALAAERISCYVSSKSTAGIERFLERTGLALGDSFSLPDLVIARVDGRGRI